jgi:hypothetical protein
MTDKDKYIEQLEAALLAMYEHDKHDLNCKVKYTSVMKLVIKPCSCGRHETIGEARRLAKKIKDR